MTPLARTTTRTTATILATATAAAITYLAYVIGRTELETAQRRKAAQR